MDQGRRTLDSRRDVSFQNANVSETARDTFPSGIVQAAVWSGCPCYVRLTKLADRFPEAPQLVKKLHNEAASANSGANRRVLGVTNLGSAISTSTYEHELLLHIETVHTRALKQNAALSRRNFYFYAASLLQEPRSMHRTEC